MKRYRTRLFSRGQGIAKALVKSEIWTGIQSLINPASTSSELLGSWLTDAVCSPQNGTLEPYVVRTGAMGIEYASWWTELKQLADGEESHMTLGLEIGQCWFWPSVLSGT